MSSKRQANVKAARVGGYIVSVVADSFRLEHSLAETFIVTLIPWSNSVTRLHDYNGQCNPNYT